MMRRTPIIVTALVLALQTLPAGADHVADCRTAENALDRNFSLPKVTKAIAAKRLNVLVLGAGSSSLPGPEGTKTAYPARLQLALAARLPEVAVHVVADVKAKRTAVEMVQGLGLSLASAHPALLLWQTATVDAMQSTDPDQFSQALDRGVAMARSAGADVIFINPQYSPRTESMIALHTYSENMRWVAVQHTVPVFDRFNIMKLWAELGIFDFNSDTKKLDMAERVHDCLGLLLADFVVEAAKSSEPPRQTGQ
jgi:hypothetical protein